MDNNFSQRVRDIMAYSREEAERLQNNYIGPEHLMLAILRDGEGMAIQVLQDFDVDITSLKNYIDERFRQIQEPFDGTRELVINKSTEKALKMSILEARLTKSKETGSEHILLALLKEKNTPIYEIPANQVFIWIYSSAFHLCKKHSRRTCRKQHRPAHMGPNFTDDDEMNSPKIGFQPRRPSQAKNPASEHAGARQFREDITVPQWRTASTR